MSDEIVRGRRRRAIPRERSPESWLDRELADCDFEDEQLGKRFRSLIGQLSSSPGDSIPLVCQDWGNIEAAYRFLDSDRVSEVEILGCHFQATRDRAAAANAPILLLHDTTEFTYKRDDIEAIEKLNWYAQGWKIETFHKILKSGCRAEQSKLRTAERLVNLLATFPHFLDDDAQPLYSAPEAQACVHAP
jgi:hypothetical protein